VAAFRLTSARPTRPRPADSVNDPIADLYAGSWEGFVGRRAEMVAAIRSSGDRFAAKAVAALRKPTRGAWLVNMLVHREPARVAEVFELGEELARAHRDANADELRRLSATRKAVIDSLTQQAVALGSEQGYSAPDSVRQEVSETLQAGMADPAFADKVLAGALVATVRAAGFGPADVFAPALADVIPLRPRPAKSPQPAPNPAEVHRRERERGRAEGRLEEARERLERVRADEERAREELDTTRARRTELDSRIEELGQLLAAATAERDRVTAREGEWARILSERIAAREATESDAGKLLELVEALTKQLNE
jgi:hypothetical protein